MEHWWSVHHYNWLRDLNWYTLRMDVVLREKDKILTFKSNYSEVKPPAWSQTWKKSVGRCWMGDLRRFLSRRTLRAVLDWAKQCCQINANQRVIFVAAKSMPCVLGRDRHQPMKAINGHYHQKIINRKFVDNKSAETTVQSLACLKWSSCLLAADNGQIMSNLIK